jgi:hypothetical protein
MSRDCPREAWLSRLSEICKFLDNLSIDIGPNESEREIRSDIDIKLFDKSCVPPNEKEILTREGV